MGKRVFSARTTAILQREVESNFYGDTASIIQVTPGTLDANGIPAKTPVSTSVSCSFTDEPSMEIWRDFTDVEEVEAEIRYAGSPTPAKGNTVTLSGRFDSTYTNKTYEVIGIRDRGAMGYMVALKAVAT